MKFSKILFISFCISLLLSSCSQSTVSEATAIDFTNDTACALDGMLLSEHPGPKAQIHYQGQEQPEFYCDTVEFVSIVTETERKTPMIGLFVQDMAVANWEAPRGHWIPAKSALFIHGASKHGSMGPTIASFSERAAAEKFVAQYGGKIYSFAELKSELAVLDGHALHDKHM